MENLYDRLAKQYDFWINDTIDVSSLNILGPKKFFAETFKTLYRNLSDNTVMQKLLLYEMSVINEKENSRNTGYYESKFDCVL